MLKIVRILEIIESIYQDKNFSLKQNSMTTK